MHKIVNPQQTRLFDPFDSVLTEKTRKRLLDGWPGVFRHVILELMPVDTISGHFDSTMGRPTKELYSMAGLILLMEFMDWTKEQALDAYSFNMNVHYALNLEPVTHDIAKRTLERHLDLFEQDDLAKVTMNEITTTLVKVLGIKIDKQRLDSTHIFSDMAGFGRTRMMGVAIKRFLTQVIRDNQQDYNSLDESFRQRYAPGVNQLFADTRKDGESRRLLRQQVAEDMYMLVKRFGEDKSHADRNTYKALERIFYEQCDVREEKVSVKAKTGGNVIQNPSDPDATYDGHKGPGYQVQISETCHPQNEAQIIVCAIPQTAVELDTAATSEVLDNLQETDLLPQELFADAHYCSDQNHQDAAARGVELVGPVQSNNPIEKDVDSLNVDDFNIDEQTEEVICCPAGHKPVSSIHDKQTGKTKTIMPTSACSQCEFRNECPVEKRRDNYYLGHTAKKRRLAGRRREENTDAFRERYRIRGGIEGTNSGLKRKTGLGRLRVRGRPRVFHSILLKITGWNILRAAACAKMREIVYERANRAVFRLVFVILRRSFVDQTVRRTPRKGFLVCLRQHAEFSQSHIAA
jgi:hypothetical protein